MVPVSGISVGEREIIQILLDKFKENAKAMPVPFGDDVSAYSIGKGRLAILKTDMLVGKTDVPPKMSFWQAARKAVVMNVSDFAAKGVKPKVMLVSLGLPGRLTVEDVKAIGDGLSAGAREYGVYIVGGDTNEASDLVISLSVFGMARKDEIMLRSGAKPGDVVAVTGLFGKASAGLKILLEGLEAPTSIRNTLIESVYMPTARLKEGLALKRTRAATASIDSSDGLAWSLYEISKASGVGFLIDSPPVAPEAAKFAEINELDPVELAFYGGEEYELVLTVKPELWDNAKKAVEKVGGSLVRIGRATAERQVLMVINGERRMVEPRGWEHFRKN
ncbi:MAG: thiamine-phosphate kinase [Nitrososphaerota archaeon]|nr:thiamine-phosphate kinase [Candidatus Bathyarchaeota archaeon]MDW8024187.1 thiamine-phosphate kinase [Nitrososphaerota archaeon]